MSEIEKLKGGEENKNAKVKKFFYENAAIIATLCIILVSIALLVLSIYFMKITVSYRIEYGGYGINRYVHKNKATYSLIYFFSNKGVKVPKEMFEEWGITEKIKESKVTNYYSSSPKKIVVATYVFIGITIITDLIFSIVFAKTKDNGILIFSIVFMLPLLVISCIMVANKNLSAEKYLLFASAMLLSVGATTVIEAMLNRGYKGPRLMNYGQKLLEVLIQLALIPVSAVFNYIAVLIVFMGVLPDWFSSCVYKKIKHMDLEEGEDYNVGESDKLVTETVSHNIYDSDGVKIGSYDTQESHIEHDNGWRHKLSHDESTAIVHPWIALPLRFAALYLSIKALFIPNLYVKARLPKVNVEFDDYYFRYFDTLVVEE